MDCLFCKIVSGAIPAKKIFEDEHSIAFHDIHPQAPVHLLIVPKLHLASLAQLGAPGEQQTLLGHLLGLTAEIAVQEGLYNGFRTVINTGSDGGQTVDHLHLHLLGGRALGWPPG